jgi:LPXTG-motif cell wall-anchored protein
MGGRASRQTVGIFGLLTIAGLMLIGRRRREG